eukprot:2763879-Pleurochrysis_carterae.AAC.1
MWVCHCLPPRPATAQRPRTHRRYLSSGHEPALVCTSRQAVRCVGQRGRVALGIAQVGTHAHASDGT